jgi:hypothetical protein
MNDSSGVISQERDMVSPITYFVVLQRIGNIWKSVMSEDDREYYSRFAADAKREYKQQMIEYRATGTYRPSKHFAPLDGTNIWVRLDDPSPLEMEISSYETYTFPPRPSMLDEAYEERQLRSVLKRKLRDRKWMDSEGNMLKEGVDFDELLEKERQKKRRKRQPPPQDRSGTTAQTASEPQQPKQHTQTAVVTYESLKRSSGSQGRDQEGDDNHVDVSSSEDGNYDQYRSESESNSSGKGIDSVKYWAV